MPRQHGRTLTVARAKKLEYGEYLFHRTLTNAAGTQPVAVRVTGMVKTWKTRPNDFRVPVKYGLKDSFYITPSNMDEWTKTEWTPKKKAPKKRKATKRKSAGKLPMPVTKTKFRTLHSDGWKTVDGYTINNSVWGVYKRQYWYLIHIPSGGAAGTRYNSRNHALAAFKEMVGAAPGIRNESNSQAVINLSKHTAPEIIRKYSRY